MAAPPIPSITGGAGGSAGPSNAGSNSGFDNSGWNVNFGSGKINDGGDMGQYLPYVAIAAALLIAFRMTRKK